MIDPFFTILFFLLLIFLIWDVYANKS